MVSKVPTEVHEAVFDEGCEGGVDLDELGQLTEVTDVVVEVLKIYVEDEVGVS